MSQEQQLLVNILFAEIVKASSEFNLDQLKIGREAYSSEGLKLLLRTVEEVQQEKLNFSYLIVKDYSRGFYSPFFIKQYYDSIKRKNIIFKRIFSDFSSKISISSSNNFIYWIIQASLVGLAGGFFGILGKEIFYWIKNKIRSAKFKVWLIGRLDKLAAKIGVLKRWW
jgi:hypothetical protein